jgi:hypothetical protein
VGGGGLPDRAGSAERRRCRSGETRIAPGNRADGAAGGQGEQDEDEKRHLRICRSVVA